MQGRPHALVHHQLVYLSQRRRQARKVLLRFNHQQRRTPWDEVRLLHFQSPFRHALENRLTGLGTERQRKATHNRPALCAATGLRPPQQPALCARCGRLADAFLGQQHLANVERHRAGHAYRRGAQWFEPLYGQRRRWRKQPAATHY